MRSVSLVLLSLVTLVAFADDPAPPLTVSKTKTERAERVQEIANVQLTGPLAVAERAAEKEILDANTAFEEIEKAYGLINGRAVELKKAWETKKGAFSADERRELRKLTAQLEGPEGLTEKLRLANARVKLADEALSAAVDKTEAEKLKSGQDIGIALATLKLKDDFHDTEIRGVKAENKLAALSARLDGTMLGVYMQDKLEGLLATQEFCTAAAECAKGQPGAAPSLNKGLFDKKTHGSGK